MHRRSPIRSLFLSAFSGTLGISVLLGLFSAFDFVRAEGLPNPWFYSMAAGIYLFLGTLEGLLVGFLGTAIWGILRRRQDHGGDASNHGPLLSIWAAAATVAVLPWPIHALYHGPPTALSFVRVIPASLLSLLLTLGAAWLGARLSSRHRLAPKALAFGWVVLCCGVLFSLGSAVWNITHSRILWTDAPQEKLPNIAIIVIDNLRADHVGSYGCKRPTSPNLDRIATEGIRFEHAVSTSNYTAPPHASLLTGRYPTEHGLGESNGRTLAQWNTTLAELLSQEGYATVGVVSNPQLSSVFQFGQGFDVYDDSVGNVRASIMWLCRTSGFAVFFPSRRQHFAFRTELRRRFNFPRPPSGDLTNEVVLGYLQQVVGRPWFLFANYVDPHFPWTPPADFAGAFEMPEEEYLTPAEGSRLMQRFAAVLADHQHRLPSDFSQREIDYCLAKYDREIEYLDQELDRLFEFLEERGELDNTLLIITADHGEHFGEEGLLYHGNSLLSELVDVPLIIRYPPLISQPGTVSNVVSLVDVPATVLDFAHVTAEAPLSGHSLLPYFREESRATAVSIAVSEWQGKRVLIKGETRAYFDGDVLLSAEIGGTVQGQHRPIPAEELPTEVVDDLQLTMAGWLSAHGQLAGESIESVEMDENLKARLRALGYVD
jgi:arylsulfatase A-like enzyme